MRVLIPALFAISFGCNSEQIDDTDAGDGGQFGEEAGAGCKAVTETALGADEANALGFTAQEALDVAVVDETDELLYVDASKTGYHLTVAHTGGINYIEQEWDNGGSGTEMAGYCPPFIALDVHVTLDTDDGLFAETWDGTLQAWAVDDIVWSQELETPGGTFDIADFADDPSEFDSMSAWVSVSFDALGSHGKVEGQGEGTDGEMAFAQSIQVGSWPAADQY